MKTDWRGIAAVILATGVMATVLAGAIAAAVNPARLLSSEEIATVATVLGGALGAVAVYMGTKATGSKRTRRHDGSEPPP